MEELPPRPARRLMSQMDEAEVRQWEVADSFTRIVRDEISSVKKLLDDHMKSANAHPESDVGLKSRLDALWDERNESRGMLRVLAWVVPVLSMVSPFVAAILASTWHK